MVRLIRQWSGEKKVGHTGTLDPMATGVLPICLGQATRIAQFISEDTKNYYAEIELGVATDTYDATGRITERHDVSSVTLAQIEEALDSLRSSIEQKPPMYSAVKYRGKRLYQLAAAGIEVERHARRIRILHLDLIDWRPPVVTIKVECGKGTYIRTLAHDLGQTIGCGAHITDLIRLRCGPFRIEDGVTIPQIEDAFRHSYWQTFLYPIDTPLLNWKATIVGEETRQLLKNGCPLPFEAADCTNIAPEDRGGTATPSDGDRCRAYSVDGHLTAILQWQAERKHWQPYKVFSRVQN